LVVLHCFWIYRLAKHRIALHGGPLGQLSHALHVILLADHMPDHNP